MDFKKQFFATGVSLLTAAFLVPVMTSAEAATNSLNHSVDKQVTKAGTWNFASSKLGSGITPVPLYGLDFGFGREAFVQSSGVASSAISATASLSALNLSSYDNGTYFSISSGGTGYANIVRYRPAEGATTTPVSISEISKGGVKGEFGVAYQSFNSYNNHYCDDLFYCGNGHAANTAFLDVDVDRKFLTLDTGARTADIAGNPLFLNASGRTESVKFTASSPQFATYKLSQISSITSSVGKTEYSLNTIFSLQADTALLLATSSRTPYKNQDVDVGGGSARFDLFSGQTNLNVNIEEVTSVRATVGGSYGVKFLDADTGNPVELAVYDAETQSYVKRSSIDSGFFFAGPDGDYTSIGDGTTDLSKILFRAYDDTAYTLTRSLSGTVFGSIELNGLSGIVYGDSFGPAGSLVNSQVLWNGQIYSGTETILDHSFQELVLDGGVPEPASWSMLILGFGLVGAAFRRRTTFRTTAPKLMQPVRLA